MGQCADRLEPDSRILVRHLNGQQRERVGEPVLPVSNDASRRASHSGVGRSEQSGEQFRIHDVERLVRPKPFELVVLVRRVLGVEIRDPRGQVAQHSSCAALLQDALGLGSRPALGGLKCFEQFRVRGVDELRALDQGATLRGDAPDAAAGVVAAVVAEVDFAVLDDRVVPVGDVDRAVGAHLDVYRAERGVLRLDQLALLARGEPRAVVAEDISANAVAAEVVCDQATVPAIGEVSAADHFKAAILGTAGIEPLKNPDGVGRGEIVRAGERVVDPLAAGAVGREGLSPAVKVEAPGVHEASDENAQLHRLGAKFPNAAAAEPSDAQRGFDVAVYID